MKYTFIRAECKNHCVKTLCHVMGVSTSGYYDWFDRPLSQREQDNQRLLTKIRCFHKSSHSIYGSPRIQKDLIDDGEFVSRQRVARLMKSAGIQSKVAKKFVITTNSRSTIAPSPDRLKRNFKAVEKNKAWVSDTTFIRTRQGWLYLAVMIDLYLTFPQT